MDEDARAEHYAETVVKQYDGKLLSGWDIAEYIEDRQLWWTRAYHDRYLTDQLNRLSPLPECLKGQYGSDEDLMSMTSPPPDRTADYQGDDEEIPQPSPVKVSDLAKQPETEANKKTRSSKASGESKYNLIMCCRQINTSFVFQSRTLTFST